MKRLLIQSRTSFAKIFMVITLGSALSLTLISFRIQRNMTDDILKQLGISKPNADSKISSSLIGGSLDAYGVQNLKNIALSNRTGITKSLLLYTRQYVNSAAFIKDYNAMREQQKPVSLTIKSPEQMQQEMANAAKKSMADIELKLKTADDGTKAILEKTLESVRKQLKQVEDPNNKMMAGYRNGYPDMVRSNNELHQKSLETWEAKYPANHLLFIKQRLLEFMEETKDIDFNAALQEKQGVQYFTNPGYERKSERWKMAFRAGVTVVEPARAFVQEWILAIK